MYWKTTPSAGRKSSVAPGGACVSACYLIYPLRLCLRESPRNRRFVSSDCWLTIGCYRSLFQNHGRRIRVLICDGLFPPHVPSSLFRHTASLFAITACGRASGTRLICVCSPKQVLGRRNRPHCHITRSREDLLFVEADFSWRGRGCGSSKCSVHK